MIPRILFALVLLAPGAAAGNVTATLSADGTELVVVGSPEGDSIRFWHENGYPELVGFGTTINGSTAGLALPETLELVIVDLGAGDDALRITDTGWGSRMHVNFGAGNDSFSISNSEADELVLRLGAGDDRVSIADGGVDRVIVRAGRGADRVEIGDAFVGRGRFFGGPGLDEFCSTGLIEYGTPPKVVGFETRL